MIFDDGDLRLKKFYKKFGSFNYLLYLCNTKRKQIDMAKQNQHHCKGCIHYHYCQAQPEKGCYTSKKEISVDEKIARRKELQKFYKKIYKKIW